MSKDRPQLFPHEPPLLGTVRILRGQLRYIDELVRHSETTPLTEDQVHDLRKTAKSSRALWRLLQGAVDEADFDRVDERIASTARRFAMARERAVRQATFKQLSTGCELEPEVVTRLEQYLAGAPEGVADEDGEVSLSIPSSDSNPSAPVATPTEPTSEPLSSAIPTLHLHLRAKDQRKTLMKALKRCYRRGQRALEKAAAAPTHAELLHDFRKQVKYHINQLTPLRTSSPLRKRRKRLENLADLLGLHHDIADLEGQLRHAMASDLKADVELLLPVLQARHREVAEEALALGHSLYKRRPSRAINWLCKRSSSLR